MTILLMQFISLWKYSSVGKTDVGQVVTSEARFTKKCSTLCLCKEMKSVYSEHYKMLLKEIKEDPNK